MQIRLWMELSKNSLGKNNQIKNGSQTAITFWAAYLPPPFLFFVRLRRTKKRSTQSGCEIKMGMFINWVCDLFYKYLKRQNLKESAKIVI
jgi:hypothetical protein